MEQVTSEKSTAQLIAEIHENFSSAGERLLAQAQAIADKPLIDALSKKAERLKQLGFVSAEPVHLIRTAKRTNARLAEFVKNLQYYQQHYPSYKFIDEEEVRRICDKYKLAFGEASNYKGDIPEKNIAEIEAFVLRPIDYGNNEIFNSEVSALVAGLSRSFASRVRERYGLEPLMQDSFATGRFFNPPATPTKPAFKIVAPLTDFHTEDTLLNDGYKLEAHIPDPIVLQPVKGGYLIVSKWGLEASDPGLVNEVHN